MKEKREIKERDKRGRQLHQTKPRNVRAKKIRKRKGKEEDKESIGAKKEKIIGAREEINPRNVGAKKIRQCVQKLNLL